MFEENQPRKIYVTTIKKVVQNLSGIKNCKLDDFKECVIENFDDYNYDGEDEVVGFDNWGDISSDGEYQLNVKVNHENAYEFTLYVTVKDSMVDVTNVL